jgi:chemotaxis family two-component system response regulator Rcp1
MSHEPAEILVVEDDSSDAELLAEALQETSFASRLTVIGDGEGALSFLRREAPYTDAKRPDLILLDLNLPRMHGRDVLQQVKSDPNLRAIPVIIFTTGTRDVDVEQCYRSGANCYVTKAMGYDATVEVARSIESFWLGIARLPSMSAT